MPAINIRESDLFALYLADKLLVQYEGTPVFESLRSMFRKIEDSLPDKVATKPGNDQSLFTVLPPLVTVCDCLRTSDRLEIEHRSPGREPAWRQIDPCHGVRFEGDWYVVGHCHLRGAIRTFSLARMVTARKGMERVTLPLYFVFRRLIGSHFGMHWGEDEVEADGSLNLTLSVNYHLELKRLLLSWGDDARGSRRRNGRMNCGRPRCG